MDQKPSNIPAEAEIKVIESNKMESMQEAISTREDFLKFVNELPVSIESCDTQYRRLMPTSELNDSPKDLDTEEDYRRHSAPIKIQIENKTGLDQLTDLCELMEGLSKTPQDHSKVSKGSSPRSFDCVSSSSKSNIRDIEFPPRTPEIIIKDNILSKIADMEQQQQSQKICTKLKMSSSDSDEEKNSRQRPSTSLLQENETPRTRRKLMRSSRVEHHDIDDVNKRNFPRHGSCEKPDRPANLMVNTSDTKLYGSKNSRCCINVMQKSIIKDHLVHPSISELRSPISSCSESNISELNSCAPRDQSVFSSERDSSIYSDYEEGDDFREYENIGSGIVCRIEVSEDPKLFVSKGEESFPLQRSNSYDDSSKQKMLSFPEWLKPIRRHSATSLISSSSMVTQPGTNKDLRYGIHPAFHHQNVTSYNNSSQIINQFNLIESNSDIKNISNKPSKSPWGRVKKMIYTRRGSLKKEFGKKEFDASGMLNRKRNSTGSALAHVRHPPKLSNANDRKFSHNLRGGSSTEDAKTSFVARAKKKSSIQSLLHEHQKHKAKDTIYKPSEPLSDADEESNLNSPIFGRRNMEDYFYDTTTKNKEEEENEYSDPSGVWMGPPDKREPKISDNRFERSSLTLNDNERFQKETEKVRVIPVCTHNEKMGLNQDKSETLGDKCNYATKEEFIPHEIKLNIDNSVNKKDELSYDKKYTIPERHRKAASLQYHPAIDSSTNQLAIKPEDGARPRVSCSNLESLRINENSPDVTNLEATPNMTSASKVAAKDNSTLKCASISNDTTWDKVKKVIPGNIINSFSVPTSPTELCPPSPFDEIQVDSVVDENIVKERSLSRSKSNLDIQAEIQRSYEKLQRNLSQEFQRKMDVWSKNRADNTIEPSNLLVRMQAGSPTSHNRPMSEGHNTGYLNDPASAAKLPTEFKRKYEEWQKMKSTPTSGLTSDPSRETPTYHQDTQKQSEACLSPEFKRKLEAWNDKMKETKGFKPFNDDLAVGIHQSATSSPAMKEKKIRARPLGQQAVQEQDLKPEFRLKVAEWEVIKAMAGQSSKKVEEIQKLMPDDFNRKLKEWEQIKETGEKGRHGMEREQSREAMRRRSSSSSNSHPVLLNRKGHKMSIKHRHDKSSGLDHAAGGFVVSGAKSALVATKTAQERDSAWLEKEIHKVQREKERLDRERMKYAAKEEKLQKMYQATLLRKQMDKTKDNTKEEITVKTAKGEEFKFGGISQKFTKKLFEWEERKGITPESSTIALISPQYGTRPKGHGSDIEISTLNKRRHSEGSFLDSATSTGAERPQSKSRYGSGGDNSGLSSQSSNKRQSVEKQHVRLSERRSIPSRQVKCSRNDSLRTQVSIQLLDEKLSMIDYLRSHLSHCRELENALNESRKQLEGISSFRKELSILRTKKTSENLELDEIKEISNKGSNTEDIMQNLIVEQSNLEKKQQHLEEKLKEASTQHDSMTQMLIDRLDRFSRDEMGHHDHFDGSLRDIFSEKSLKSASLHSLTMFGRIQKLSEFLATETKLLKNNMQKSQLDVSVSENELKSSKEESKRSNVVDIPPELFSICKDLREELVVLMQMQSLEATIASERRKNYSPTSDTEELSSRHLKDSHRKNSAARFRGRCKKRFSGSKNVTSFSESDLRYYSKHTFSNRMDTDDSSDTSKTQISSTNSMSRYGSASPLIQSNKRKDSRSTPASITSLEVQNLALGKGRRHSDSSIRESISSTNISESGGEMDTFDDYDSTKREKYEKFNQRCKKLSKPNKRSYRKLNDYTLENKHSTDQTQDESSTNKDGNPISYHMSSENISTPNSGRSRSESLISSDYISEEEAADINGNAYEIEISDNNGHDNKTQVKNRNDSNSSFERLYNLVHELKEEDLNSYRAALSAKNSISPSSRSEEKDESIENQEENNSLTRDSTIESMIDDSQDHITTMNHAMSLPSTNAGDLQARSQSSQEYQFPVNSTTFCLNDILVPTLPVLITPISLNTSTLYQANSGIPMRRNMEFHQDIGTAAYVSIIQNAPVESKEQCQDDGLKNVDSESESISYTKSDNIAIVHDQIYPSIKLAKSVPLQENVQKDHSDGVMSQSYDDTWKDEKINPSFNFENKMRSSLHPFTNNKDSIESVESLICPPVATASTVPANSCLCESTIASQNALPDDSFQPTLVSIETKDSGISQIVDGGNDTLVNNRYVFCNDEVTFYSPGMVVEDDEVSHEDDVKVTNIQIQINSTNLQNDQNADTSGNVSSTFGGEMGLEQNIKNLETSNTIQVVPQERQTEHNAALEPDSSNRTAQPIQTMEGNQKSSPLIQRNKKSLLSSPPLVESLSATKTEKQSSRPKSFSSFFQHLETKYFPYKQQLSYEPPSPSTQQQIYAGASSMNTKAENRNASDIGSDSDANKNENYNGSLDALSVKPKKQKKSSVFRSFFMSSSPSNQNLSQNKLASGEGTPKSKVRKCTIEIPAEKKNEMPVPTSIVDKDTNENTDCKDMKLSELKPGLERKNKEQDVSHKVDYGHHKSQNLSTENEKSHIEASELKLRSQERAKQIKKAREEFLCISGTSDKRISTTSSVGALLSSTGRAEIQRVSHTNAEIVAFCKQDDEKEKKDSNLDSQNISSLGVSSSQTSNDSHRTKKITSDNLSDNRADANKSYSCPSSPKF